MSKIFDLQHQKAHRALDDALATVDVLHALIGRAAGFGISTLEELTDFGNRKSSLRARKELDSV
jgi:DNA polymerase-3 subunit epsilon